MILRHTRRRILSALKQLSFVLGYGVVGAFILGLILYVRYLENRPDLEPWHSARLDEEFHAGLAKDKVRSLADYLSLEARLFDELREEVYARVIPTEANALLRFTPGSPTDPRTYSQNWNRTFELSHPEPRAGVLLLHGLSDSPYSVRVLARTLHQHGAWVVALRVPGHGTAPVGLTEVTWQDFAAATRIGANHVAKSVGTTKPFYMVGFSNGAALAVHYTLAALEGEDIRTPDGLLLLSPAIGITRAAMLAVWQARLANVTGLKKVAWSAIFPEYDPFKYESFPINAGEQMYQLTQVIASKVAHLKGPSGIKGFPRVLAFQSLVDATVIAEALVDTLMRNLVGDGHELVLFDVNRVADARPFFRPGKERLRDTLLSDNALPFTFTLVTNLNKQSTEVMARQKLPQSTISKDLPLSLSWPDGIYSLTHVALPFAPDDSLYGYAASPNEPGLHLGRLAPRGERGVLIVSPGDFLRLRANPFFPYLEQRMLEFFQLADQNE